MAITASEARKNLFPLLEQVNDDRTPIEITSKKGNAVLLGQAEYDALWRRRTSCAPRPTPGACSRAWTRHGGANVWSALCCEAGLHSTRVGGLPALAGRGSAGAPTDQRLLEDCLRDPFDGIGKPEQLRHALAGAWSRRITEEHRLVYLVDGENLIVLQVRYHY